MLLLSFQHQPNHGELMDLWHPIKKQQQLEQLKFKLISDTLQWQYSKTHDN